MNPLLVSVDKLKERMVISSELLGVEAPLESAIRASQLRVAAFFDSQLSEGSYEDIFFLDADAFSGLQPGGLFRLFLKNAFVSGAPSLFYGESWGVTTTLLDPALYTVDAIRGLIYVDSKTMRDKYVRVIYTAGFAEGATLPDWLTESILAYAPVVFNMGQVTNRSAEAEPGYKISGDHALALLSMYTRNKGMCMRPLF